ncbi:ATP-dependent helicase HrpB [Microbacterium oryzae]|uniref:ATP-dependent helicase HrpB n=1 Tax=Microbacterium oryzae TaxID=743009 RepID=UPI0025AF8D30|nr:ATP-dependent helicase HrpB [Microbacterium oryzae]MDN3311500.1 ATP-dependent helicase HrpB [Microbacterium oryzae]
MPPRHIFDLARIGAGLTVSAARPELEAAATGGAFVVTAPPGTGKTTFVPPLVANLVPGRALLTQPRRVAVRAAARRIAQLDGSPLGGPAGFTIRGEREVSTATRIEALTPGVLLRRLLADPALEGVDAVVLDEVHERSLDGDLLLGMLAEVRALRDDLLVVAMSATVDAAPIAALLGDAAVVDIPSPLHPLAIEYAPMDGARLDLRGVTRPFLRHVADVAVSAQREDDALVFLPSAHDVDEVVRLLRERGADALPLHGRLSARDQDLAIRGTGAGDPPRIIVSTALAESSLTVPGVRLVIDAGLSREVRRDRARDMTGLVTVSASRASADQRAGRAARQGPGRAIRLYAQADFARMAPAAPPEIASADLVDAALLLGAWGTPGGEGLALLTPPPAGAMASALAVLRELALIDGAGRPTELGRRLATLPVGVRAARALLDGAAELGDARAAAEVVAAISDDHRDADADLPRLLRALRDDRAPGAARWRRETTRLARIATDGGAGGSRGVTGAAGVVVALARPDWIARRTGEGSRSYLLASGTRAALPEGSALVASEWIAVHDVQRMDGRAADGTGAVIRLAAPLSEEDALHVGAPLLIAERSARIDGGRVRVRLERRLGAIVLSSTPAAAEPGDAAPALAAHLRAEGLEALDWTATATALRGRLTLVHRHLGAPWPAVDDDALLDRLDDWLEPDLARMRPDASLQSIDVAAALRRLLPWPEAARLGELAPERLAVPSGSTAGIEYPAPDDADGLPVVAVKLQEVFGLARTPRLVGGRVPVLFHLLSPARRPLAVTADLESFWNGPYQDVRKEMRGRYPRHPWPEDPWTAPATAKTNRRLAGG